MSTEAMAWAWRIISSTQLKCLNSLVLLRLADRADPRGVCWPGHERTAQDLQASERGVRAAIQDLKNLGLIKIEHRHDAQGRNLSNLYYLNLSLSKGVEGRGQNFPPGGKNEVEGEVAEFSPRAEIYAPEAKSWNLKDKKEPKRESRAPARAPAGARGAPSLRVDGNGIHYQEGNEVDAATLSKIYEFSQPQITAAVKRAEEKDPRGRAFPSAVARILLSEADEVPPWMRAVLSHVGSDVNRLGVENE